jgi:hypothetical protein
MARSPNLPPPEPRMPAEIVKQHRADWRAFTHAIALNCAVVAAVLLLMLLFLRIL